MRKEIENWWKQGKNDLEKAKVLFTSGNFDGTAFYCQQAVEKVLKCLILFKTKESRVEGHSLIYLGKQAGLPQSFFSGLKTIKSAVRCLPVSRYVRRGALRTIRPNLSKRIYRNCREGITMDRKTATIAKKFALRIKKAYAPQKVILFGSRARMDHFNSSDFDFIVVSKKFANVPFVLRAAGLYDYWDEDVDLEVICYTPEEFERKKRQIGIAHQAVKEGIEIA